jgi:glycosyltransferase involved in cell wall biosynthesis
MRILMVSPYPPARDGIAAYAVQTVSRLRQEGHDVEVLSPGPSAAHHHLDLVGPRGALALAKRVRAYDRVMIQFHPDFFYPLGCEGLARAAINLALTAAFRAAAEVEVIVHEIDYRRGPGSSPAAVTGRLMWQSVDRIVVHTEGERDDFVTSYGVRRDHVEVADHGADFVRRVDESRDEARRRLGIDTDGPVFLSIGFIQPHKGFDRALRAFATLPSGASELYVVGSVRVEEPEFLDHLDELERLVRATPGAHLRTEFVSDVDFDRWLVAADTVVLPYRFIWSSGVLERAALYGTPVIVSRVGGLADQAGERAGTTVVDDDAGLARAMARALGATSQRPEPAGGWEVGTPVDRDSIQSQIRERAASVRGGPVASPVPSSAGVSRASSREASAPLRRVPPLAVVPPTSVSPLAALVKKVVRKLTAWQLDPLVHQVNRLRQASIQSVEAAASSHDLADH